MCGGPGQHLAKTGGHVEVTEQARICRRVTDDPEHQRCHRDRDEEGEPRVKEIARELSRRNAADDDPDDQRGDGVGGEVNRGGVNSRRPSRWRALRLDGGGTHRENLTHRTMSSATAAAGIPEFSRVRLRRDRRARRVDRGREDRSAACARAAERISRR